MTRRKRQYTAGFFFCGSGGGALGFLQAEAHLLGCEGSFRSVGGIDIDAQCCADFEYLTESHALCADMAHVTPAQLRGFMGRSAPDVVFGSAPCKGSSRLLSEAKSQTAKYRSLNRLTLLWIDLLLSTWNEPPKLVLIENVPGITTRAKAMLDDVRSMLRGAGYLLHDGFHCCGELGGLAQRRRRFLLVARHAGRVPPLLYQPPRKRVRGVGEVLGPLPMPEDTAGGPMHTLPRLSWLNWVRLSIIPAGGDWRDLPGVLMEGQKRREVFRRQAVERWDHPSATIGGPGSNGATSVADPRINAMHFGDNTHTNLYKTIGWQTPSNTVTGATRPGSGALSISDPRVELGVKRAYDRGYCVLDWRSPSNTIAAASYVGCGSYAAADPRVQPFGHVLRVTRWDQPCGTVTKSPSPSSGASAVADPRGKDWYDGALGVTRWDVPSGTITGKPMPTNGRFAIADERARQWFGGTMGVLDWKEAASTITAQARPSTGPFSVADVRLGCSPRERSHAYGVIGWEDAAATITGSACIDNGPFAVSDPRKPPPFIPVIVAADGTWHRPLTTLELAMLQGLPFRVRGEVLQLAGKSSSSWRERIGNMVPAPAARAIAEAMLVTLIQADAESFTLCGGQDVWVHPSGCVQ